jgi:L-phenylalanine/L-methionine N-acetyltransferase
MAVSDDWQGKGVGTALMEATLDLANNWLDLTRIELEVFTDNQAGIALYKKFGSDKESTPTYATPHLGPDEELQESTREHYGY